MKCELCNGTGEVVLAASRYGAPSKCPKCGGTGIIYDTLTPGYHPPLKPEPEIKVLSTDYNARTTLALESIADSIAKLAHSQQTLFALLEKEAAKQQ